MKRMLKEIYPVLFGLLMVFFVIALQTPATLATWQHFDPNATDGKLPSYRVTGLVMSQNRLWVGTDEGLAEYNPQSDDPVAGWTVLTLSGIDIYHTPIHALDADSNGVLWLGTSLGLVSYNPSETDPNKKTKIHPGLDFFDPNEIHDIATDPNFVWIATDTGVNRYDRSGHWILYNESDMAGFDSSSARSLATGPQNTLWALPGFFPNPFGVYKYKPSDAQWDYFTYSYGPESNYTSLAKGANNDMWFGTYGAGLWRLQLATTTWTQQTHSAYGLPSNFVTALGVDYESNRVMAATDEGIARYDQDLNFWQPIGIPGSIGITDEEITSVLIDPARHQAWFGTEAGGLFRWQEEHVIWSSPENNSVDVPVELEKIDLVFYEPIIDPNHIKDGITFSGAAKSSDFVLTWLDPNINAHLILTPKTTLAPNSLYNFKFTITDNSGDTYINYNFRFNTVNPPRVVATDPNTNAVDVPLDADIEIQFNKLMDHNSFTDYKVIIYPALSPLNTINITMDDMTFDDSENQTLLTISPQNVFSPSTTYVLSISNDVKDLSGSGMMEGFDMQFTTVVAAIPPQIVFISSGLNTSPYPYDGATNVSIDANIRVTFNHSMDANSVQANFGITPAVPGSFTWRSNMTQMVFDPTNPLAFNKQYTVSIGANAKDADGVAMGTAQTWQFTTKVDPESLIPHVVSILPAEDDSSVSVYTAIKITFDLPMARDSVADAFLLTDTNTGTFVAGAPGWNTGSTEFTFKPSALLTSGHVYEAILEASAKAGTGIYLTAGREWSFKAASPQEIPPAGGGEWPLFPVNPDFPGIPPMSDLSVTAMAINPIDGGLWAGFASIDQDNPTDWQGLGLFHFDGTKWIRYTSDDPNTLASDAITDLAFDSQGRLWIATEPVADEGGGVSLFDIENQEWRSYTPDDFYMDSTDNAGEFLWVKAIGVYENGGQHTVWIATKGGIGLGVYAQGSDQWEWTAYPDYPNLSSLAIDAINGEVWFGSWAFTLEPCESIYGIDIISLLQDKSQPGLWPNIWADPNIWLWSSNGGTSKIRALGPDSILRAMAVDKLGNLWVAANNGLYRFSLDLLKQGICDYESYNQMSTGGGLLSSSIFDLTVNPSDPNQLWIATGQGISVYNPSKPIDSPDSWFFYPLPASPVQATGIVGTEDGGIQVGTDKGLFIVNDETAPVVTASYPSQSQNNNIPVGQPLWVTFSEFMDTNATQRAFTLERGDSITRSGLAPDPDRIPPSSLPSDFRAKNIHALEASGSVQGQFTWEGNTLKFALSQALDPNTQYTMTIGTGAVDLAGNHLSHPYTVNFTTSSVAIVSWLDPEPGDPNFPVNKEITINFATQMDPNTTEAAFCLMVDPNVYSEAECIEGGTFSWTFLSNNTITQLKYTPPGHLLPGTTYIVTIDTTATDAEGNPVFSEPYTFSFTTAGSGSLEKLSFEGAGCFVDCVQKNEGVWPGIWNWLRSRFDKI